MLYLNGVGRVTTCIIWDDVCNCGWGLSFFGGLVGNILYKDNIRGVIQAMRIIL